MCVIFVAESERPTLEEVSHADRVNSHGIGVAWIRKGYVHWTKGITLAQAKNMAQTLPMPFAMHFRWATEGPMGVPLCHPFPIEERVRLDPWGKTSKSLLMHNGHWHNWKEAMVKVGGKAARRALREGVWSDSRAVAWILARSKNVKNLLDKTLPGLYAHITPSGITTHGHFPVVRKGLWASNMYWQPTRMVSYANSVYGGARAWDDFDVDIAYERWNKMQNQAMKNRMQLNAPTVSGPPALQIDPVSGAIKWPGWANWDEELSKL